MQTINAKYADKKQPGAQEVSLHIEGLPSGGSAEVADGSITTAKLASKAVTADKIADGVIPEDYTLPAATTGALGGVKKVAFVADPAGDTPTKAELVAIRDALVASGLMAAS